MLRNSHLINLFYENKFFFSQNNEARPALFLDRDGVVIKEKHFISNQKDVELETGIKDLFEILNKIGIPIIIITNQSGIARGLFTWDDYLKVTEKMLSLIDKGNSLIAIYSNGLTPTELPNTWRKPNPEMLNNASHTLNIDLSRSVLIGDRLTDLIAGHKAGIPYLIHTKTGHGEVERIKVKDFIRTQLKNDILKPILIDKIDKLILKKIQSFFLN